MRAIRQEKLNLRISHEVIRVLVFPKGTKHRPAAERVPVNHRVPVGKIADIARVDKRRTELVSLFVKTVVEVKIIVGRLDNRQIDRRVI